MNKMGPKIFIELLLIIFSSNEEFISNLVFFLNRKVGHYGDRLYTPKYFIVQFVKAKGVVERGK